MTSRGRALIAAVTSRVRSRLASEHGAILVLAAGVSVAVLASTAIAVDIGHGAAHKRDLQKDADVAALDAVRALGDRKNEAEAHSLTVQEWAERLAEESLERNGFEPDEVDHIWSLLVGRIDPATWTFSPACDATSPAPSPCTGTQSTATAVKVMVASPIDFAFRPGGGTYNASSVADVGTPTGGCQGDCDDDGDDDCIGDCGREAIGGISLGSWLARLDTSKSTLTNALLTRFLGAGSAINLSLVSYQGLADASINLQRLRSALNLTAGTPEEFLDTSITMKNFLAAMATALTAQGDTASLTAVTPLATLSSVTNSTLTFKLGDLISLAQGAGSDALDASLNVFTLASMAAQVADADHFITLTTPITIPGVASSTLDVQIIEAPRIAIGPAEQIAGEWAATVETAQIRVRLNLSLQATATLSVLLLGLVNVPVQLPLYIEGAGAEASIRSITCNETLDTSTMGVHVDSQAAKLQVGAVSVPTLQNISATVSPTPGTIASVNILGLGLLNVTGTATHSTTTNASDMTFTGPWNMDNTQTNGGSTTFGLSSGLTMGSGDLSVNLAGIDVAALKASILGVVNPVLSILDDGIVDDLLTTLGLSLGGADVTAWHLACRPRSIAG